MNRKGRILFLILAFLPALFFAGCSQKSQTVPSAAQTPEISVTTSPPLHEPEMPSVMDAGQQEALLMAHYDQWAFPEYTYEPWFYTFTDLDHNGRLEVIAASTQGTGIFTWAECYEVDAACTGIANCIFPEHDGESWPELILEQLPCYYDSAADRYFYACEDVAREGAARSYASWNAISLKDGVLKNELLAWKFTDYSNDSGLPAITCRAENGTEEGAPITEMDYDSAVSKRFAGMEQSTLKLDWTRVDAPPPEELFTEQAPSFTGQQVIITKNPTSEAIAIGGKTWFIAHADNAVSLTWECVSPDGGVYSLAEAAAAHSGLTLDVLEGDTLAVSNVPLSFNGWGIQARFNGAEAGNTAVTTPACLYVGDFLSAYGSVIEKYRAAYASGNSKNAEYAWTNGISEMTAYSSGVGYALKDLDKNGIPELIIAGTGTEEPSDRVAYHICTLVNNAPVDVAVSWVRMCYFVRTDSSIYSEGSGGASYCYFNLYRLNGASLAETEMVFSDADPGGQNLRFYYQQGHSDSLPGDSSVRISEDDFWQTSDAYKSLVYVPPLTTIWP